MNLKEAMIATIYEMLGWCREVPSLILELVTAIVACAWLVGPLLISMTLMFKIPTIWFFLGIAISVLWLVYWVLVVMKVR